MVENYFITITETYLSAINNEKNIQKYLESSPFLPKNLEIFLSFPEQKDQKNSLKSIGLIRGQLIYSDTNNTRPFLQENYETAYSKVFSNK